MTPDEVSRLDNDTIENRLKSVLELTRTLKAGTPEYDEARANLAVLEEEIRARDFHSPTQTRTALLGGIAELRTQVIALELQQPTLFTPGAFNAGALSLFRKRFADNATSQLKWINDALDSATRLATDAPARDVNAAFAAFAAAGTRLIAAMFGTQLLSLWTAFLSVADFTVRHPSTCYSVEHLLVVIDGLWPRFVAPLAELSSLDMNRVQSSASGLGPQIEKLVAEHGALVAEIELAAKRGQQLMAAAGFVQLLTSLAAMRINLPPSTGGPLIKGGVMVGAGAGGVLAGSQPVISVEWAEMIRRLIAAGVIVAPVAASGVRGGMIVAMAASNAPPGPPSGMPGPLTGNQVITSGTGPLRPGRSDLGEYGIDGYGTYANRPRDRLAGHELLQNLWLEVKGFGLRLKTDASRNNPAVALSQSEHAEVGRQQGRLGLNLRSNLEGMSAEQNIEQNVLAMRRAGIPENVIQALRAESLRYAATLSPPATP
jgi:hypothetical protein